MPTDPTSRCPNCGVQVETYGDLSTPTFCSFRCAHLYQNEEARS